MHPVTSSVTKALAAIGSLGGYRSAGTGPYTTAALRAHAGSVLARLDRVTFRGNRWMPHQGSQEVTRRLRQQGRINARRGVTSGGSTYKVGKGRIYFDKAPPNGSILTITSSLDDLSNATVEVTEATARLGGAIEQTLVMHPGQVVDWTSSGTTKRGVIEHVIPVGKHPSDMGIKLKSDGAPRDHRSYVVRADGRTYWPRVSLLKLATP